MVCLGGENMVQMSEVTRKLCVNCLEKTPVKMELFQKISQVNGEEVKYNAKKYTCQFCGDIVPDKLLNDDNFEAMYRQYRKSKNFLMPEDVKFIREDLYNLSTRYFAKIMGCSPATVSRIENGGLQSKQHENQYRLVNNPENMKVLFNSISDELEDGVAKAEANKRINDLIHARKVADLLKREDVKLDFPSTKMSNRQPDLVVKDSVESYFISKNTSLDQGGDAVTPLKLQKLMYYAHGWCSALNGEQIISEDFQAWVHGPVLPSVYSKYKRYGFREIPSEKALMNGGLTVGQLTVLDWVWDKYGQFTAKQLESLTHHEAPWMNARGNLSGEEFSYEVIKKESIDKYFSSLLENIKLVQKFD